MTKVDIAALKGTMAQQLTAHQMNWNPMFRQITVKMISRSEYKMTI